MQLGVGRRHGDDPCVGSAGLGHNRVDTRGLTREALAEVGHDGLQSSLVSARESGRRRDALALRIEGLAHARDAPSHLGEREVSLARNGLEMRGPEPSSRIARGDLTDGEDGERDEYRDEQREPPWSCDEPLKPSHSYPAADATRHALAFRAVKIAKLETHVLEAKLDKPILSGLAPFPAFTAVVVEITTDDGIIGFGECIARKAPRVVDTVVRDLLWPLVKGRDPHDVEGLWDEMFGALRGWGHYRGFVHEGISGIDQALWDILAKAQGIPLYKALGGAGRATVPCYASSVYVSDRMTEEACAKVAEGFTAVKIKIGRSADLGGTRADIDAVRAIREAVGPKIDLMVDVNGAYDAATAIRVCRALERYDITWVEEPVFADDYAGYELVRRSQAIPVAGGETEFGVFGFRELIARRALDVVQPQIGRVGGFTAAKRVGALVHAYNLKLAPHTGLSGGVAYLAALHLAAAAPALLSYEYWYGANPLRSIFSEAFPQPKNGTLALPRQPGLGLELDRAALARFRIA